MGIGRREQGGGALDELRAGMRRVGPELAVAPDRAGPGRIGAEAPDHVDVELRHHVAERRDVDLVGPRQRLHHPRGDADLAPELGRVGLAEVGDLAGARAPRHQDQPGEAGIVHQEDVREREVAHRDGVGGKARVEGEIELCIAPACSAF